MTATRKRYELSAARDVAEAFARLIAPYCERLDIAGSIRREKPHVKDIEIVTIPRHERQHDLFGAPVGPPMNLLTAALGELARDVDAGIQLVSGGPRLRRLVFAGVPVDLHMVPAETYGAHLAIRTGPSEFSKLCVTSRFEGGFMPPNMVQADGALWRGDPKRGGTIIPTPDESDWFDALGLPTWPPKARTAERLRDLMGTRRDFSELRRWQRDKNRAVEWARSVVSDPSVLYLDTETTGLKGDVEIIEVGICDAGGNVIVDTLVKPSTPIPPDVTGITGITDADVRNAPTWDEIGPHVNSVIAGRRVVIYNADFDKRIIQQVNDRHEIEWDERTDFQCAMQAYAAFAGEWDGVRGSYRWQKLAQAQGRFGEINASHRALDDALACRDVVRGMAGA